MHEDDAAAWREAEWRFAETPERSADGVVPRRWGQEHQEAAAAGAQQLAALGARGDRRSVRLVDQLGADAGREAPLQPPGPSQHRADRIEVSLQTGRKAGGQAGHRSLARATGPGERPPPIARPAGPRPSG